MNRASVLLFSWVLLGHSSLDAAQTGDPYFSGSSPTDGAVATAEQNTAARANTDTQIQFLDRRSFEMPVMLHDQEAREIRLYVSSNGGRQWQLYNRFRPDAKNLPFTCRNDGEYWFSLYTINQANAIYPMPATFEPMLKLRVDTQRPLLEAQAYPAESGGLAVRWKATDPYLNPATARVEYRAKMAAGRELPWRDAALPAPSAEMTTRYEDTRIFWPETNARVLEVRISVSDWAGNLVDSIQEVAVPLVTQTRPAVGAGPGSFGSSNSVVNREQAEQAPTAIAWRSQAEQGTSGDLDQLATRSSGRDSALKPVSSTSNSINPSLLSGDDQNWGTTAPMRQHELEPGELAGRLPSAAGGVPGRNVSSPSQGATDTTGAGMPSPLDAIGGNAVYVAQGDSEFHEELPPPLTSTQVPDQALLNHGLEQTTESMADSTSESIAVLENTPGIPTGEVARLTREKRFRLSYEVESAGPRGVAKVQLWMTDDAGQTWRLWGEDPDCKSPIAVQVPDEGVYGFRLVITAMNGLAGDIPKAGDLADMWVEVDQTAPKGDLLSAPYGEDVTQGTLVIRWQASDRNLGRRPITLHISESPSGPWNVLSAGLPNTGQYDWQIVPSLPKRVYLRLEVKDRAGNIHMSQLDRPVDLSALSPRGTLRGFEIN
jgi:hypothetical protein